MFVAIYKLAKTKGSEIENVCTPSLTLIIIYFLSLRVCLCMCLYVRMYLCFYVCMYDVYEMMCEETRNLMPVLLLLVAVSMIGDIQKTCNHVNRKFIASSVLPGGSSRVDAAKLLENSISD